MIWLEALKYGPAGLSALVALWTAGLLTVELQRPGGTRNAAYRMIKGFMFFSLILVSCSLITALIGDYFSVQKDRTMSNIREEVSSLNSGVMGKMIIESQSSTFIADRQDRELLMAFTQAICESTNKIAEYASSGHPAAKCQLPAKKQNPN